MQISASQDPSSKRRRVLLITGNPSSENVISTFLVAMGHTCCAASNWNALTMMLERETFDAVLLDLLHPPIPAEKAIVKIKEIVPTLAHRLLVIGSGAMEPKTAELIEYHGLSLVSQDNLVQQLWTVLQEIAAPPDLRTLPSRYVQPARMIFDSLGSPPPAGVRSLRTSVRQFVYQHENMTIDILMETAQDSGRLLLTGQVLSAQSNDAPQANLPVLLISGIRTLMRTTTDGFGEFNLDFEPTADASLEIRLLERLWVSIPLRNMEREGGLPAFKEAG